MIRFVFECIQVNNTALSHRDMHRKLPVRRKIIVAVLI